MTADALLSLLDCVRRTGPGRWIARCPAHQDRSPSLSIRELDDGRLLIHDFGGCATGQVLNAIGIGFDSLFPLRSLGDAKKVRHPFPAADVLRAVADELTIIGIIAGDIEKGRAVTPGEYARLRIAIERILAAKEIAFGG